MKKIISFVIMSIILCLTTSQTGKPTQSKVPPTDSTAIISLNDLRNYSTWLRDNISVNAYSKLSPEATLTELWNWKLKQLSDTTKPKK